MRILMTVHHHLDPDAGAAGVTLRLAEQYTAAGHQVQVLSFDDLARRLPAKVTPLVFPAFVAARVRHLVRRSAVDVVDASTGDSALLDAGSRLLRQTLLVVRSHGLEHATDRRLRAEVAAGRARLSWRYPLYHGGYRLREVARSMRLGDVTLVLNEDDRRLAIRELGLAADRVGVVPNGVPEGLLSDDREPRPGTETPVTRILQMGSYIPRKGILYGVPAVAATLHHYPGLRVAFLGTGCSRERVLADFDPVLHPRIDVRERYRNEELPDLLGPGDVNLFPTLSEGFGLALLEAMARGIPSVVTATPGPNEFCRDGLNALVVPPADAQALERGLRRLIDSAALRRRLSREAVATARKYTWPRVASDNLDIYQGRLARKRGLPVPSGRQG